MGNKESLGQLSPSKPTRKPYYRKDAPCIWISWKISGVPGYTHGYFSRIVNGLLLWSIV